MMRRETSGAAAEGGKGGGAAFTGERLVAGDELFAADLSRHLVAYRHACEIVRGKRVLDAGCGDGYGSQILAAGAAAVLGVDRSPETIAAATGRYRRENLEYCVCELDRLASLGRKFDVVCNFQVIEHLHEPIRFLEEVRAVLEPAGMLVLTTPNRVQTQVEIPYHVREYTGAELREVLARVFPAVEVSGICGDERVMAYERARVRQAQRILRLDPLGLRRLVPQRLIEMVYPHLARLVRRGARRVNGEMKPIMVDNFFVSGDLIGALDLLAVCRV